jgi:copper chaperone CopZ
MIGKDYAKFVKMNDMKKIILGFLCGAFVLTACDTESKESTSHFTVEKKIVEGTGKAVAKIGVEGMACGISCVKKIESTLNKLEGVKTASVDFKQDETTDFANIEYDEDVITEKEMIAAIESLGNGQYKVNSVEVTISKVKYEKIDAVDGENPEKEVKPSANNYSLGIKVPNLLNLVRVIVN